MYDFLADIGTAIGFLSMFPQMRRTIMNRKTLRDLSLASYVLGFTTILLFVIYFSLNGVVISTLLNVFSCGYYGMAIFFIIRASKRKEQTEQASR